MDDKTLSIGTVGGFYGVDHNRFKLGRTVYECVEDEDDGYRSALQEVRKIPKAETEKLIFYGNPVDTVRVDAAGDCNRLVSVVDGHVWLEYGTDYSDDYYPCFVFTYTPRPGK